MGGGQTRMILSGDSLNVRSYSHDDRTALRLSPVRQPAIAGSLCSPARGDLTTTDGDDADFGGAGAVHGTGDAAHPGEEGSGGGGLHGLQRPGGCAGVARGRNVDRL